MLLEHSLHIWVALHQSTDAALIERVTVGAILTVPARAGRQEEMARLLFALALESA